MKEIKYTILYCVFLRTFLIGTILLRFRLFDKLRFRFHRAKSYGSYGSGSGSATLAKSHFYWIWIRRKFDQLPVPVPVPVF
jgi:hypothetical protein